MRNPKKTQAFYVIDNYSEVWSGRQDLNLRPPAPQAGALPGCATPRRNIVFDDRFSVLARQEVLRVRSGSDG